MHPLGQRDLRYREIISKVSSLSMVVEPTVQQAIQSGSTVKTRMIPHLTKSLSVDVLRRRKLIKKSNTLTTSDDGSIVKDLELLLFNVKRSVRTKMPRMPTSRSRRWVTE